MFAIWINSLSKLREYPIMTPEYPIMTFSGLSFSNIFSVPKSNISDNDKYMRKLSGFVVLNFRMKKYPINYPILSRTSCTVHGVPMTKIRSGIASTGAVLNLSTFETT